jgi:hypothetical protein
VPHLTKQCDCTRIAFYFCRYQTTQIGNRSLNWIRSVAGGPKPFFAYLGPHAPHYPAQPAPWCVTQMQPADAMSTHLFLVTLLFLLCVPRASRAALPASTSTLVRKRKRNQLTLCQLSSFWSLSFHVDISLCGSVRPRILILLSSRQLTLCIYLTSLFSTRSFSSLFTLGVIN